MENPANKKKIIICILAVGIISTLVFLSQQSGFSAAEDKNLFSNVSAAVSDKWAEGINWVSNKAYPTLLEESQKRGEMAKNAIDEQKEEISENILEKVGNYFSGIKNSIVNPGSIESCPTN
jgi:hypothetical protein